VRAPNHSVTEFSVAEMSGQGSLFWWFAGAPLVSSTATPLWQPR
jgi:hypothetical protein